MNKLLLGLVCLLLMATTAQAQEGLQVGGGFAATIPVGVANNAFTPGIGLDAGLHYRFADEGLSVGLVSGFYRFWPDSTTAFSVNYIPIQLEANYFVGEGDAKFYAGMRGGMARYIERTRDVAQTIQNETRKYLYPAFSPQLGLEVALIDKLFLDIRLAYAIILSDEGANDYNVQHFTVGAGVRYNILSR